MSLLLKSYFTKQLIVFFAILKVKYFNFQAINFVKFVHQVMMLECDATLTGCLVNFI